MIPAIINTQKPKGGIDTFLKYEILFKDSFIKRLEDNKHK